MNIVFSISVSLGGLVPVYPFAEAKKYERVNRYDRFILYMLTSTGIYGILIEQLFFLYFAMNGSDHGRPESVISSLCELDSRESCNLCE